MKTTKAEREIHRFWKRFPDCIELDGELSTVEKIKKRLRAEGVLLTEDGDKIMKSREFRKSLDYAEPGRVLRICTASSSQLTEGEWTNYGKVFFVEDVINAIKSIGGRPCPLWVGPYLRLRYTHQLPLETVLVASEPALFAYTNDPYMFELCAREDRIDVSRPAPHEYAFDVRSRDRLILGGFFSAPRAKVSCCARWVFAI